MVRTKKEAVKPTDEKKEKRKNKIVPPEVTEARQRMAYHLRMVHVPKMNLYEITEELNKQFPAYPLKSDHEAVRKMIKRQQEVYAKQDKERVEEVLAETSAVLDFTRDEAIQAWLESKGMVKTVKKKTEQPVEQSMKQSAGDAKFLDVIKDSAINKAKLFGVVAPKKLELRSSILANIDPNKLPTTVLRKLAEAGNDIDAQVEVIFNYVLSKQAD